MIFKNITDIKAAVEAYREAHPAPAVTAGEQRITAALCDMDGTLYDSMSRHSAAWFRLMTELGVECERDEFYLYEGMTGANTIRHLFKRAFDTVPTDEEVAELYHRKTQYFCELPKPDVMPGAQELIRFCVSHGVRPVLVTGSGQNTLINRLDADYDRAFSPDLRVTSYIVKRGKPDPEPYLMALKMAGVDASRAFVVENAPLGVESGARAGVFTIAVATGPIPRETLDEAGASIVFSSMPECAKFFPELLECLNN